MRIDILTLFPEMCEAVVSSSIIGRAVASKKVEIICTNIRDYANNKHNKVDDTPYGGGMGMVMSAEPIDTAFASLYNPETEEKPHLIRKKLLRLFLRLQKKWVEMTTDYLRP